MEVVVYLRRARGLSVRREALRWRSLYHAEEVDQVVGHHEEASEVLDPMAVCVRIRKDADSVDDVCEAV